MKSGLVRLTALSVVAMLGGVSTALADSASASCEARKDGESAMRNRGYTWVGTAKGSGDPYSYWRENENGQDYQYRCGATDFYSGGQKVRTELRYPDQTIQLAWRAGNRVGLQFEGMKPMEARYSTSEGETNWVFEGKTYYYFSDKGRAQSEWNNFRD
jgi:hypothetical protein